MIGEDVAIPAKVRKPAKAKKSAKAKAKARKARKPAMKRAVSFCITLPRDELRRVDAMAKKERLSRSAYIRSQL